MELLPIVEHYRRQGAPADQTALVALLREVQQEAGGAIPKEILPQLAAALGTKESFLLAIIGRMPSLRLSQGAVLELCAGPNCGKAAALAACAEKLCAQRGVTLRYSGCMRLCGKGPNIKYNGTLYHRADEKLLRQLLQER